MHDEEEKVLPARILAIMLAMGSSESPRRFPVAAFLEEERVRDHQEGLWSETCLDWSFIVCARNAFVKMENVLKNVSAFSAVAWKNLRSSSKTFSATRRSLRRLASLATAAEWSVRRTSPYCVCGTALQYPGESQVLGNKKGTFFHERRDNIVERISFVRVRYDITGGSFHRCRGRDNSLSICSFAKVAICRAKEGG